ncbi:MAG: MFS transporter [Candidatus Heimdallarchaeota archaeon]
MENKEIEITHSKKNMVSYGFGQLVWELLAMAFGAYVFFYYEAELGLDVWLVALGFIIYAIWNAVNDPFVGYLVDRPFKFTKKWGRRFPWVIFGGIPWILSYFLLFIPPDVDPKEGAWILFAWLVITTCLYDTFASIFNVNFFAILPDKFRIDSERRNVGGIRSLIGSAGVVLGFMIPPLFIVFGDRSTYAMGAGACIIVCFIALGLSIPGVREDQYRIDCYLEKCEEGFEKESFFRTLRYCLKQKNFMAYIIAFVFYMAMTGMMIASLSYLVRYVFKMEAGAVLLLILGFLIGSFCSIPVWTKIAHKTNNDRKLIIITAFYMAITLIPFLFLVDYYVYVVLIAIWAIGLGGFYALQNPVYSNAIDETVIKTNKREEAIYQGIMAFFQRLALVIQAVFFAIVHTLTGFEEGADTQSELAQFGTIILFSIIPMALMFIGVIILWKFYDLTPEKVKVNKEKLAEIGL